jgi:hypothetical protein
VLAYGMLVLSFPAGLALILAMMFVYMGAAGLFGFDKSGYLSMVVQWWTMAVAGYWQWFKLVPWIWRKIGTDSRNRRNLGRAASDGEPDGGQPPSSAPKVPTEGS